MKSTGYNDLPFRLILALIAGHIIIMFGAKESTFFLLMHWFYYRDMLFSVAIAFGLVSEVYFVTVRLDKNYDWKEETVKRIGLQIMLGLVMPTISAFLFASIYYGIFGVNILDTNYLRFDLPVIAILIILLNVYYLAFYFFRRWQHTESLLLNNAPLKETNQRDKRVFLVQKGAKNIPIPIESIAYFYHEGDYNFLRTDTREDFIINQTLDDVQKQLSVNIFFRANRQILINFNACDHYKPLDFGKVELIAKPNTKDPVTISQKRAKAFKEWMAR